MPLWDVDLFKSTKDPAVLEQRQIALSNVHLFTPHDKKPCDLLDLDKLGNVVAQGTLDWGGKLSRECRKAMKQKGKDATGKQEIQFEVMEWSLERKDSEPAKFKFVVWVSSGRVWYSIKSISPNWTAYTKTSLAIQTLSALAQVLAQNQTLESAIVLEKVAQALSRSADDIATLLNERAQFFHTQLLVFVFDHAEPRSIHPKCPILQDLSRAFRHGRLITPSPPPPLALVATSPAPDSLSMAAQPRQRPTTPVASRPASAAAAGSARSATPSRPASRTSSRLRGASPEVVTSDRAESPLSSPFCNPSSPSIDAESLDEQPLSLDRARTLSVPAHKVDTARGDQVESHVVGSTEPSSDIKVTDSAEFGDAEWRDTFWGETRHERGASADADVSGGGAVSAQQLTVGATRNEEQEPAVKRESVAETSAVAEVEYKAQIQHAELDLAMSVVVEVPMYPSMRCQFESCIFVGGAWDDLFAHYEKAHDLPFHAPDDTAMDVDQDEADEFFELPPIQIAKRPPLPFAPPSCNSRPFHFHRTLSVSFEPRAKPAFRFAVLVPPREPPLPVPVPVAKRLVLPLHVERAPRMRAFAATLEPAWAVTAEESDDEDGEVVPHRPNESAVANLELADAFDDDVGMDDVFEPAFPATASSVDPARDAVLRAGSVAALVVPEHEPSPPLSPQPDFASYPDAVEDGATVGSDRARSATTARIASSDVPSQGAVQVVGATDPVPSQPPSPPGPRSGYGAQLPEATLDALLPVPEPADFASDVGAVKDGAVASGDRALTASAVTVVPNNGPRPRLIDAVGGTDPAPPLPPSPPHPSPSHGTEFPEPEPAPTHQFEPAQPAQAPREPSPALSAASPVPCVVISGSESSSPGSPPLPTVVLPAHPLRARSSVPTTPTPRPTPEPIEALAAAPDRPAHDDAPIPPREVLDLLDSDDDDGLELISPASQPAVLPPPPPPPPPPIDDAADDDDDEVQIISPRRPALGGAFDRRTEPPQAPPRNIYGNLVRDLNHLAAPPARPAPPTAWGRQTRSGVAPLPNSPGAPAAVPDRPDAGWLRARQSPPDHHGNPPPPPPPARHRTPPPLPSRSRPSQEAPHGARADRRAGPADVYQMHQTHKRRSETIVGDREGRGRSQAAALPSPNTSSDCMGGQWAGRRLLAGRPSRLHLHQHQHCHGPSHR
ncbi:hypothetical protein AMAG_01029 [Allomyces macrogynus ATCC 38327]|uniref:Uncharacterized protein n=1 Tax=Allomyces macrogynus (strain ATCC 38327) TaxID=578462 RepID=A0A0L0RY65_ALLM3|nr:hypothetical protein AMAG_01029 [Allomyces macrogynus ATCC 38327]|eukprot:KNE55095.1 hypothetical protein AMAG_01029 [Allomyces macrogynus ATCC 38327]